MATGSWFRIATARLAQAALVAAIGLACRDEPPTNRVAAGPSVVRAAPDHADVGVDPAVTEIRVEFDRDMRAGSNSICGGGPTFPKLAGKPRWEGARVCVIPVTLEPNHRYDLSINCPAARNFVGADGTSATPYPISFMTGEAGSGPKALTRDEAAAAVAALRDAIRDRYSYRDQRGVDWDAAFAEAGPELETATTPAEFARRTAALLARAGDIHITVGVGPFRLATHRRFVDPNMNIQTLQRSVPGWTKAADGVYTGRYEDGVGYILIGSWSPNAAAVVEPVTKAIEAMRDAKGIVIDVRPNSGGDERLAQQVAGCLIEKPAVYSRSVFRDPAGEDGFTAPIDRVVEPRSGAPAYRGKVAVLIGPANMSSCESFILMLRYGAGERARLFGDTTYGSSGNPKPVELGNGVTVYLPSWKDMLPDGTVLEGRGIEPDQNVPATAEQLRSTDPVLEAALGWLRGK